MDYAKTLRAAREKLITQAPFYGPLIMPLKIGLDDTVGTASTDGRCIRFDPTFMDQLQDPVAECTFLLLHEVLHCALSHLTRRLGRKPKLFNIACDIVVNSIAIDELCLDPDSFKVAGESPMHMFKGCDGRDFSAEEIYEELSHCVFESDRCELLGLDWPHECLEDLNTIDCHVDWDEALDDPTLAAEWAAAVEGAIKAYTTKGGAGNIFRKYYADLNNARLNWRDLLRDFLTERLPDYTWSRPDRRFSGQPFILPGYYASTPTMDDIVFAVDVSGSISEEDQLSLFMTEVDSALRQVGGSGWLISFDEEASDPIPFDASNEEDFPRFRGCGGTNFFCVTDKIKDEGLEPRAVVFLTDGQARFPSDSEYDILWVFAGKRHKDPPFGSWVEID